MRAAPAAAPGIPVPPAPRRHQTACQEDPQGTPVAGGLKGGPQCRRGHPVNAPPGQGPKLVATPFRGDLPLAVPPLAPQCVFELRPRQGAPGEFLPITIPEVERLPGNAQISEGQHQAAYRAPVIPTRNDAAHVPQVTNDLGVRGVGVTRRLGPTDNRLR